MFHRYAAVSLCSSLAFSTAVFAQHADEAPAESEPLKINIPLGGVQKCLARKPKTSTKAAEKNPDAKTAAWTWGLEIEKTLQKTPGLGNLFKDYESILRPGDYSGDITSDNTGIISYLDTLLEKDPVFRGQAAHFYDSLHKSPLKGQPGELYRRALNETHGSPLQALRLIAACGHDNVSRSPSIPVGPEALRGAWRDQVESLTADLTDAKIALQDGDQEARLTIREIEKDLRRAKAAVAAPSPPKEEGLIDIEVCPPPESTFFASGVLDASADISPELKQQLNATGTRDNYTEHQKNYHVLAAAFVACEMVSRGHPPHLVVALQKVLAWAYRTSSYKTYFCDTDYSGEHKDAVELMRRWSLGGQNLSALDKTIEIPQSNFSVSIPPWLDQNPTWNDWQKPKGWTNKRYSEAKKEFKTIMLGWDWTIAQHEAGARFGAKVCAK